MWQSILALSDLPNFSHIEQSFLNPSGLSVFKTYCDASTLERLRQTWFGPGL